MLENRPYTSDRFEWRRDPAGFGYDVLDYGYLKLKRTWGSDQEIIETARMSTDKGFLGWVGGLVRNAGQSTTVSWNDSAKRSLEVLAVIQTT